MSRPKITDLSILRPKKENQPPPPEAEYFHSKMNEKNKAISSLGNVFRILGDKNAISSALLPLLYRSGFKPNDIDNLRQRLDGMIQSQEILKAERQKQSSEKQAIINSPWYQIASLHVHKNLDLVKFNLETLREVRNRYRKNDIPLPLKGHEKTVTQALIKSIENELVIRKLDEPEDPKKTLKRVISQFRGF